MPGAHKKKTKGAKVKKRKADTAKKERKAEKAAGGDARDVAGGGPAKAAAASKQRNPKAFIFSGSGKAKKQAARTAEKEQRRMHGRMARIPDASNLLVVDISGKNAGAGSLAWAGSSLRSFVPGSAQARLQLLCRTARDCGAYPRGSRRQQRWCRLRGTCRLSTLYISSAAHAGRVMRRPPMAVQMHRPVRQMHTPLTYVWYCSIYFDVQCRSWRLRQRRTPPCWCWCTGYALK